MLRAMAESSSATCTVVEDVYTIGYIIFCCMCTSSFGICLCFPGLPISAKINNIATLCKLFNFAGSVFFNFLMLYYYIDYHS